MSRRRVYQHDPRQAGRWRINYSRASSWNEGDGERGSRSPRSHSKCILYLAYFTCISSQLFFLFFFFLGGFCVLFFVSCFLDLYFWLQIWSDLCRLTRMSRWKPTRSQRTQICMPQNIITQGSGRLLAAFFFLFEACAVRRAMLGAETAMALNFADHQSFGLGESLRACCSCTYCTTCTFVQVWCVYKYQYHARIDCSSQLLILFQVKY